MTSTFEYFEVISSLFELSFPQSTVIVFFPYRFNHIYYIILTEYM